MNEIIKEFKAGEAPENFVPITKDMEAVLAGLTPKSRVRLFREAKRSIIQEKKKELGRKLTNEEMKQLFQ